ncbi:hypothetical protein LINGRAHAP2_LOCUS14329 [Linum grandiflorum]
MLHQRLENCQFNVSHIKSKVRYFKEKFTAFLELKQTSGFGWDDVRGCVVADDVVFHEYTLSHKKASGMNDKPLPYYDDLCFIFGLDEAVGADAMQSRDAAAKLVAEEGASMTVDNVAENVDSYNIPTDFDYAAVMEDIINQGIDLHTTGLQGLEAEITSKRVSFKGKEVASSSGSKRSRQQLSDDNSARILSTMELATENLAKIATSYCIEGELAVKRQSLYHELSKFAELSVLQRTMAMRHLNRDDGDAYTFFQMPTSEEKLEFVWTILE